jgi:hypothetical protein
MTTHPVGVYSGSALKNWTLCGWAKKPSSQGEGRELLTAKVMEKPTI